jgi:hypothetical protein
MAPTVFAFEQPVFRQPARLRAGPWLLAFGVATWLMLYAGMGWRFWSRGINFANPVDAMLIFSSIALGAAVLLGLGRTWAARRTNLCRGSGGRLTSRSYVI